MNESKGGLFDVIKDIFLPLIEDIALLRELVVRTSNEKIDMREFDYILYNKYEQFKKEAKDYSEKELSKNIEDVFIRMGEINRGEFSGDIEKEFSRIFKHMAVLRENFLRQKAIEKDDIDIFIVDALDEEKDRFEEMSDDEFFGNAD